MTQFSFEKLEVYKDCRVFIKMIYQLSSSFPKEEKFGLTNQLRRATVSIALNLAEGSGRFSSKEKIRFIEIAFSSLMEVVACIDIAVDLAYLSEEQKATLRTETYKIANKLKALKKYFQKAGYDG